MYLSVCKCITLAIVAVVVAAVVIWANFHLQRVFPVAADIGLPPSAPQALYTPPGYILPHITSWEELVSDTPRDEFMPRGSTRPKVDSTTQDLTGTPPQVVAAIAHIHSATDIRASQSGRWVLGMWGLPSVHFTWGPDVRPARAEYTVPGWAYRARSRSVFPVVSVSNILTPLQCDFILQATKRAYNIGTDSRQDHMTSPTNTLDRNGYSGVNIEDMRVHMCTAQMANLVVRISHVMGVLPQFMDDLRVTCITSSPTMSPTYTPEVALSPKIIASSGQCSKTMCVCLTPHGTEGPWVSFDNADGDAVTPRWLSRSTSHERGPVRVPMAYGGGCLWGNTTPNGTPDFRMSHCVVAPHRQPIYVLYARVRTHTNVARFNELSSHGWHVATR